MADNTKDKEMAARLKGSGNVRVVRSNGVDRFTMLSNGEYRTQCRCAICHGVVSLTGYDAHLRAHGVGEG